jgi:Fe-S oxidoreductase
VGCAGAFDDRIKKQTQAMVKILNSAGVDYAVLGHREACTGDPARRAGDEMQFSALAQQNVDTLNEVKAKKIITSCPHCLHTLKNDYPQFGGNFEVIHHTQLISHLMDAKKLTPTHEMGGSITYHDSCYLGRWNGEYDAPRRIVKSLPVVGGFVELGRNREHGFCCGAGGSRMWMEEKQGARVNRNRADEIIATGVSTVAVACPFCNVMITDGMKDANKDEEVQVLDLAELVAKSLPTQFKGGNPTPPPPQTVGTEDVGVREE